MTISTFSKVVRFFIVPRNENSILMLSVLLISLAIGMYTIHANYNKTAAAYNYSLPTVQEFHEKLSIVLYELIDRSALSWTDKLYFWSSITTVAPVVLKFSEFSLQKNSILQSRTFFAFTNGYLMCLRIYPSGYPGITTKSIYMSVFMKGPNDDALERLGHFPTKKLFTIELLDPSGDFHLQIELDCDDW